MVSLPATSNGEILTSSVYFFLIIFPTTEEKFENTDRTQSELLNFALVVTGVEATFPVHFEVLLNFSRFSDILKTLFVHLLVSLLSSQN